MNIQTTLKLCSVAALAVALSACVRVSTDSGDNAAAQADAAAETLQDAAAGAEPADAFLARLARHCGQAFEGRIIANEPRSPEPHAFEGKTLVMHVRGCDDPTRELRVPFHVGDNHSRTWILTRTDSGLRLKHDHRLEDGSDDPTTMYGGDTATAGTAQRQEFPVDQASIDTFNARDGLSVSVTNVWAMEIDPGQRFLYELSRPQDDLNPQGRLFQVEFDLTRPVDLPPTPWGY
ncbi:hypothetical protein E2F46_16065 [Luteimonas aestuarii]|uniref:Uncharacterized protein n=1 Tax=Luteimonas aestuarii TaxID=453837 RepID=A0A4R5TN34_9GAMM|nr:hypothetical protein [Luteimonas aestuarii]TDK20516.1 hypothetical protein E2F46_16065 [Luteimonas aestuarii]